MELITVKISDIGEVIGGGTPSTSNPDYWNGNIPWISPKDLTNNKSVYITCGENFITKLGLNKSGTRLLPQNTILLSSRAPIGYLAIAKNPICTNQGFKNIVCKYDIVEPLYLYYFLKINIDYIKSFASGATFPEISGSTLRKIKINIFSNVNYQRRIASILRTYDNLIENNERRIRLLEQMAENLYKEWFVRYRFPGYETAEFENGLPKGWKITELSQIADIVMGQSTDSKYYNYCKLGLPFHQGVGNYGYIYLENNIYSSQGNKLAEPNSIIFSVRAPVGRININLDKIILGRGLCAINAKNGINAFLYWVLRNKFSKEDIIGNGSIFASVSKVELNRQKIIMPSHDLMIKFNLISEHFERQMRVFTLQNRLLARERDLLLPRLMSGKLKVK